MTYPLLTIDKDKIKHNTSILASMLRKQNMGLVAVAKGTCANLAVVEAMVSGGALTLGDSRLDNLRKIRDWGYAGETMLLRAPGPSRCSETVLYADVSLNSEVETVMLLGDAARKRGKVHKVILMIDLGDLREGVMIEHAPQIAFEMDKIPGIHLEGIGTNLACYGGVIPTVEKMRLLLRIKNEVERHLGRTLDRVSGGTSANVNLLLDGEMPSGITELRIGEAILLGTEAIERKPVPGCFRDAFILKAEVIEVGRKPSKPFGQTGQNAFGDLPVFEDKGIRLRAILSVGRQDIDPWAITPICPGIEVLGASSDHLICDVQDAACRVDVGSILEFSLSYSALLKASTSPFVTKEVL